MHKSFGFILVPRHYGIFEMHTVKVKYVKYGRCWGYTVAVLVAVYGGDYILYTAVHINIFLCMLIS